MHSNVQPPRPVAPSVCSSRSASSGFSPLAAISSHFQELVSAEPSLVLEVDGSSLSLGEVCVRLRRLGRESELSDPIWAALIENARTVGRPWVTVALGVSVPVLSWKCARAAGWNAAERADVEAAAVAGFVEALLEGQLPEAGLLVHLSKAANRAAQRLADDTVRVRTRMCSVEEGALGCAAAPGAGGHPDFALADLVRERVVSREEADLIGRHRLEGVPLKQIAAERGWYPMQASRALRRAETKAVAALRERISRNG